jgi:hypothetical protein
MVERIGSPRDKNQETDQDSTDRVDIPDDPATDDRHGKTEGVDDNIIAMVDEEDMNSRVASVDVAVDAQRPFAEDGCCDERDGDDVKFLGFCRTTS